MLIKIKLDGSRTLLEIARFCGCAPCQIIALNGARTETELFERFKGQTIEVPVIIKCLVHKNVP